LDPSTARPHYASPAILDPGSKIPNHRDLPPAAAVDRNSRR
jgi:hypothetical protein